MMSSNNKKPKVLMVNYEFPPIGGGGGTTTRFLAKYIAKKGVDVSVITSNPGNEKTLDHPDGFKIYYVGPKKNKLEGTHVPELARFIFTVIYYGKDVIKLISPDLIHCFFALPSGCFGLYCNKVFKIPYVTSILGADVPGFNIGDWRLDAYHFLTRSLTESIWNNSSRIVANSDSLKETGAQFSPNIDIEVIHNGVDPDIYYPSNNKKLSNKTINLLFASRLMPQKGIDTLIKTCGILKKRGIENFKLTVVGDGHQKNLMYELIETYNISDKVNHVGWKTLEELADYYRENDIFILPSSMEGMPSVVLQAMACGLPIIASRVKGFEEVLEENVNGLFAEYNNEEQFADAIEKLIKNPALIESMSQNSIKKSKKFLWDSIAEKYLSIYENIVLGHKKEKSLAIR